MSNTLNEIALQLKSAHKKVQPIYAFSGTGKKLVSPQNAKQLRALGQNPSPKTRGKA